MRILAQTLLVLAAVVWAGTATAGSIDLTIINDGHVDSQSFYGVSDSVTIEVTMDSADVVVSSYFFHVDFDNSEVSLSSVEPYGPYPYPYGSIIAWAPLAGNLEVDAYGLYLNSFATGGKSRPGVFTDTWITTMVFHVEAEGQDILISPYFNPPGDVIGDVDNQDSKDQFALNWATIHTPEPTAAALMLAAIATLGFLGSRRRRDR